MPITAVPFDQARRLRALLEATPTVPTAGDAWRAQTVAIASGKGGVGKTHLTLNLAIAAAQAGRRVLIIDAHPGFGALELLCGANGYWNLEHVICGARRLDDVVIKGPEGIHILPGAAAIDDLETLPENVREHLLEHLAEIERQFDLVLIDTGTGMTPLTRRWCRAADEVVVIAAPEPTALAEAYATIKALAVAGGPVLSLVVNQSTEEQGAVIGEHLRSTAREQLSTAVTYLGSIPWTQEMTAAALARIPLVVHAPESAGVEPMRRMVKRLGCGRPRGGFWRRSASRGAMNS